MKAIVFYVKPYQFKDEKTGRQVEGVSVHYIPSENLEPVKNPEGSLGYLPVKESLPLQSYDWFPTVPGIYNLEHLIIPSGRGMIQKLNSVKYICEMDGVI